MTPETSEPRSLDSQVWCIVDPQKGPGKADLSEPEVLKGPLAIR